MKELMNHKIFLPTLLIFLLGAFLLGTGITGMIVSETCCFPPNCLEENICDVSRAVNTVPQNNPNNYFLSLGAFLMVAGAVIYVKTHHLHHD